MNAIILSAIWGVVLMYTGVVTRKKSTPGIVAIVGILLLIAANWLEYAGVPFFNIARSPVTGFFEGKILLHGAAVFRMSDLTVRENLAGEDPKDL